VPIDGISPARISVSVKCIAVYQYTSIAFAETLVLEGIAASIGSIGDAYEVSRRRGLHPPPLVEPCVKVSLHTAPAVEPVGSAPCCQWANMAG
jgi:putative transposase